MRRIAVSWPRPCLGRAKDIISWTWTWHLQHPFSIIPAESPKKVLSFYRLCALKDVHDLRTRLHTEFSKLGILGRIYLSAREGINGQLAISESQLPQLRTMLHAALKRHQEPGDAESAAAAELWLNESVDEGAEGAFYKLKIKVRERVVSDGLPATVFDAALQPLALEPAQFHAELASYQAGPSNQPLLLFDTRNRYETAIGRFREAQLFDVGNFRELMRALLDTLRVQAVSPDAPIYMYCTGGIRCSKAGSLLMSLAGFRNVRMLKGGITNYGRFLRASSGAIQSLFIGKNFTFDQRLVCIPCDKG